eukprot:6194254-Pleurochrysis_carterae.AAC.3
MEPAVGCGCRNNSQGGLSSSRLFCPVQVDHAHERVQERIAVRTMISVSTASNEQADPSFPAGRRSVERATEGTASRKRSINLDGAEDLPNKPVASVEADCAGEQEEDNGRNKHVAKVEQRGDKLGDLKLGEKVEDRISEHVAGRGARREERAPPPVRRRGVTTHLHKHWKREGHGL